MEMQLQAHKKSANRNEVYHVSGEEHIGRVKTRLINTRQDQRRQLRRPIREMRRRRRYRQRRTTTRGQGRRLRGHRRCAERHRSGPQRGREDRRPGGSTELLKGTPRPSPLARSQRAGRSRRVQGRMVLLGREPCRHGRCGRGGTRPPLWTRCGRSRGVEGGGVTSVKRRGRRLRRRQLVSHRSERTPAHGTDRQSENIHTRNAHPKPTKTPS